ncbi:hypothetical protein CTEN210_06908 [Chaetoceros tenuissimus]|uniref:ABC transporter domain-containing protein n=1 Tax=Chaetoceros tenuissimus TaxID=426638 RepID=A0AAD3H4M5_9STRA|nr:hypothetical protein CTEN210_06908 [Chaetoceros tenuissimus]
MIIIWPLETSILKAEFIAACSIGVRCYLRAPIRIQGRMRPSLVPRMCLTYSIETFMLLCTIKVQDRVSPSLVQGLCLAYFVVFRSTWILQVASPTLASDGCTINDTEKTCWIEYLILSPVESATDSYPSKFAVQDARSWGNLWTLIKICTWLLVKKKVQGATFEKYLFLWILSTVAENTLACTIIESYLNCLSLSFVAHEVKNRFDCYVDNGYNENTDLIECTWVECSGLEIGWVIAVLTYILDLFGLLYYHGSVHYVFIKALAYWRNISALLAEDSDLVVTGNPIESSSRYNVSELNLLVEFDSYIVKHRCPGDHKELKGESFKMMKVVGTTKSSFLFKCNEVLGSIFKVDGTDIRIEIQEKLSEMFGVVLQPIHASLREMIGVVLQYILQYIQASLRELIGVGLLATSLFNDNICTNITYGKRDAVDSELDKFAESCQLIDIICSLPRRWDISFGASKGKRESTAIAGVLLRDSPIVVFDEKTSVLETIPENSIQEVLDVLQDHRALVTGDRMNTFLLYCIQSLRLVFNRHLMCLGRNILA